MSAHPLRRVRLLCGVLLGLISACVLAAVATGAVPQRADYGYLLQIDDNVALSGQERPDRVTAYLTANGFPPAEFRAQLPVPLVYRDGALIAGSPAGPGDGLLADLRDGDEVRLVDVRSPQKTVLATYTYRKLPTLDSPVCAGAASYSGTRGQASYVDDYFATAVLWVPGSGPAPIPVPGYPSSSGASFLDQLYPGYFTGYRIASSTFLTGNALSPSRFSITPKEPLVVGMHLYVSDAMQPTPSLQVTTVADSLVVDCSRPAGGGGGTQSEPTATPTPTATLAPAPAPTPAPTPRPFGDKTPPKGTLTGVTSKTLRKLGRTKFLRTGLPITVETNEAGQLVGTLSLLGGKKPVAFPVSLPLFKGRLITHIRLSNGLRKALRKVADPRLRLDVALVDAAGNRQPLPPIAVDVPGK